MTDKPENPPAFPCLKKLQATSTVASSYIPQIDPGMSLRDWFAGLAMQAYATNWAGKTSLNAALAYAQADEMLKARR